MSSVATIPDTGWWDISNELYHADRTAVSHTGLERFRQSVALYRGLYVTGDIPHPKPSPAMRLGTIVHTLALEPYEYREVYVVAPDVDRRTKAGKAAWQEFCDTYGGQEVITEEESDLAAAMGEAIRNHPEASELLHRGEGRNECSLRWLCPRTGMPCKARYDRLLPGIVVNLKTAADPSPEAFRRACNALGYHRAAAMYLDGLWHGAKQEAEHIWIVVGSSPPFDVVVYRASEAMLRQGREEYLSDLARLAQCHRKDQWPSHWSGIQTIDLPRWAQTREEY